LWCSASLQAGTPVVLLCRRGCWADCVAMLRHRPSVSVAGCTAGDCQAGQAGQVTSRPARLPLPDAAGDPGYSAVSPPKLPKLLSGCYEPLARPVAPVVSLRQLRLVAALLSLQAGCGSDRCVIGPPIHRMPGCQAAADARPLRHQAEVPVCIAVVSSGQVVLVCRLYFTGRRQDYWPFTAEPAGLLTARSGEPGRCGCHCTVRPACVIDCPRCIVPPVALVARSLAISGAIGRRNMHAAIASAVLPGYHTGLRLPGQAGPRRRRAIVLLWDARLPGRLWLPGWLVDAADADPTKSLDCQVTSVGCYGAGLCCHNRRGWFSGWLHRSKSSCQAGCVGAGRGAVYTGGYVLLIEDLICAFAVPQAAVPPGCCGCARLAARMFIAGYGGVAADVSVAGLAGQAGLAGKRPASRQPARLVLRHARLLMISLQVARLLCCCC
jgi:hypothetical protein